MIVSIQSDFNCSFVDVHLMLHNSWTEFMINEEKSPMKEKNSQTPTLLIRNVINISNYTSVSRITQ